MYNIKIVLATYKIRTYDAHDKRFFLVGGGGGGGGGSSVGRAHNC